ncbi:MAG: cyclic nucleotide-binding domain-containing protein [Myxococcales bacterium]|jgi:CRP-like cAMP-binding protein
MVRGARIEAAKIEAQTIMPGAMVIHAGDEQILCGFPEEVAKACFAHKKQITAWLIPDVRSRDGLVQWALEFPLYVALFVEGLFAKGKKLTVFAQRRDWTDVVEYLRLTLLGLSRAEMAAAGVEPDVIDFLEREAFALALKRADGSVAGIEDFLSPVFFDDEGLARQGGLSIRAHGGNCWSFETAEDRLERVRLETDGEPLPPYTRPINPATTPILPQQLEVVTLGASNGFDIAGPCSNMVVQAGGHFLLIDSGPYIRQVLEASGISLNQLEAMVLTHAHEDHAVGLSALLQLGRRIRLFATRETAEIARRKLAILNPEVEAPRGLLDRAFDLVYVEPGREYDFLGVTLRFHYTMHSISCVGVELSSEDRGLTRRVLVIGDNNSKAGIERAFAAGVLSEQRRRELLELYERPCDLVIADAGGGLIHGATADFDENPSTNVVYVHTGRLPEAEAHRFTLAAPGHRYTIIPENSRPTPLERDCAARALAASFDCRSEWIGALLDAAVPLSVNRSQIVVRQNDLTRDFFVVLSGKLAVLVQNGRGAPQAIADIHPGEIFGEMAVIMGRPRTATVQALTPVRLLRVPGETFRRFAARENLAGQLQNLWNKRSDIQSVDILARLPVSILNALARAASQKRFEAGATIIREGTPETTVYVLVEGRAQVYKGGKPLRVNRAEVVLHPGQLFGEIAPLCAAPRNASVVALEVCTVLAIPGEDFKGVVDRVPRLHYQMSVVVRSRRAALQAAA